MILVLAHHGDQTARRLAALWGARVVTARALSMRGWRHFPVGGGDDVLGLDDGPVPASAVLGVVTRIGAVVPADLAHIAAEDREYVATEMTAFLLSFLRRLACPVLNRPTASSLMGPGWTSPRWRAAAIAAGLSVAHGDPTIADTAADTDAAAAAATDSDTESDTESHTESDSEVVAVTVVGERCFGPVSAATAAAAVLARRAGVELLSARFTRAGALIDVNPWADLPDDAAAAVRARFS